MTQKQRFRLGTIKSQGYEIVMLDESPNSITFLRIHPDRPHIIDRIGMNSVGAHTMSRRFVEQVKA